MLRVCFEWAAVVFECHIPLLTMKQWTSSSSSFIPNLTARRVEDEGSETVFGKYVYTLDVDQFYKTPTDMTVSQQFTFTSPTSPATCGMYLEIGTEYVVGVYLKPDGSFMAYTCGATLLWDQVTPEQLAVLEDGGDCPPPETCAELVCPDDQVSLTPAPGLSLQILSS